MYKFCPYCGHNLELVTEGQFKCSHCHKSIYLNSKPTASVIPFNNDKMLVAIRSVEPGKGKFDIIGGFLNNAEDPLAGAIREFKEETGYDLEPEGLKFLTITIDKYVFEEAELATFNVFYSVEMAEKFDLKPADDVADLRWVAIDGEYNWAFESIIKAVDVLREIQSNTTKAAAD